MSQKKTALVTVLASIAFLACSTPASPEAPKGGDDDTPTSGAAKSGTDTNGTTPADDTTTPTTPGATPDGDEAEESACVTACKTKNPQGAQAMDDLEKAWKTCACGACAAQCAASFCGANGTEPAEGDACATCLDGAAQCDTQWETACDANAACKSFGECTAACEPADAEDGAGTPGTPARPAGARTYRAYVRP